MGAKMIGMLENEMDTCPVCTAPKACTNRCECPDPDVVARKCRGRIRSLVVSCGLLLALLAGPATARAETTTYYVTNAQGTVVAQMDTNANVTYTATYRPYGRQQQGVPQAGPGYTGHVNDPGTGLVYMQARYYDPQVGRFFSVDPVQITPGGIFNFNSYDYANNNPVVNVDPYGLCSGADGSCGVMVREYGKWAYYNPKQADLIGERIGVPAFAVMVVATGSAAAVVEPLVVGRIGISLTSLFGAHPGAENALIQYDPEGQVVEQTKMVEEAMTAIDAEVEIMNTKTQYIKSIMLSLIRAPKGGVNNNPGQIQQNSGGSAQSAKDKGNARSVDRYMRNRYNPNFYYDRKDHVWRRVPISQYQ